MLATPSLTMRLAERTAELERLVASATSALIALRWQHVAVEVRRFVPEATGLRLLGAETEQGLRLHLKEVLVDGEPVAVDPDRFAELGDALDQSGSLPAIAGHEDK
jgi:hypothetical protein